ncbi:MAG: hypothetical protein JW827_10855 [Spirochaetes bacterium]|nr:hypothetical protein [Spirochaetota bacterium]
MKIKTRACGILFLFIVLLSGTVLQADELKRNLERTVAEYLARDDFQNAAQSCLNYLDKFPDKCYPYILLGKVYEDSGDMIKAMDIYLQALDRNQYCYSIYYKLGKIYFSLGKYKLALKYLFDLEKIYTESESETGGDIIEPVNPYMINKSIGKNLFILNDYSHSITYFEKAITANPYDLEIYSFLQTAYDNLSDKDSSQAYSEMANLMRARKDLGLKKYKIVSGIIFLKYKKYKKALEQLNLVLEEDRNNIILNYNMGLLYLLTNNYPNALPFIQRTVDLYNKKTRVSRFFHRLFRIDSQGAKYHLVLSLAFYLNRETEQAKMVFQQIKRYDNHVFNSYSFKDFADKSSPIYRDLADMYEFPKL